MPLNIPGLLVPFQLLFNPRLIVPGLVVKDIRNLDFAALKKAGYRGAVFDKDNTLTVPYKDTLVPELQDAWKECRETFGEGNVLVVSNSAGSHTDAGGIQAESVSHHLMVPVLIHPSLKPSYSCIASIRKYFAGLPHPIKDNELIVVGDRLFTDIVLANRMSSQKFRSIAILTEKNNVEQMLRTSPLGVWTTGVWQRESTAMRWCEQSVLRAVVKWFPSPQSEESMDKFHRR